MSLKAREVLIVGQMPSYEERLVQMEAVLKASVTKSYYGEQGDTDRYVALLDRWLPYLLSYRTPSSTILKELTDSQFTVYDVLPSFFNHTDPLITLG